ncbi:MAG: efflux RND transporter permease subunit [Bacteroidales bacterium]|nr:efflux RND transporter permease subunit [Bacteroidales bacterium]
MSSNKEKKIFKPGGFIAGCIDNAALVQLVILAIAGFGIFSMKNISKDEFPSFTYGLGIVAGIYPGAPAEQVAAEFTKPLEQLLFEFPEVNRQSTLSVTRDGIAYIYVTLQRNVKNDAIVWGKIRGKIADVKSQMFPPGVLGVVVVDDFSSSSSLLIAIESNQKSYRELNKFTEDLKVALNEIPTMGSVKIYGERQEEIAVKISQDRVSHYGLAPSALMLNYFTQTNTVPTGSLSSDGLVYPLHISDMVSSEEELLNTVIASSADGSLVRLRDVATLERHYGALSKDVNYNGNNAIILSVSMRKGYDITQFGQEVDKVLAAFEGKTPEDVKVYKVTDQPKVVRNSVYSFLRDLLISMLVVIFVMLLLFPIRTALVASSGLPICTAISIAIMYITGIELNTVTLAALIVVLGMIVDDSIINIDGYIAKLQQGYEPREAAISSARELFMPMFIATTAISAMFFPIKVLITGPLGDFVQLFPWTIAFSLAASLVYAMIIIPALEIRFIHLDTDERKLSLFEKGQMKFFNFLQGAYDKMEDVCFKYPRLTIALGGVSIAAGIWMFTNMNIQMMPMAERDSFAIEIRLPEGSSADQTKVVSDSLQQVLLKEEGVKSVTAFIGDPAPRFHVTYSPSMPSSNLCQLIVCTESSAMTEKLLPEFDRKYSHYFPNAHVRIRQLDYQAASTPVEIYVLGDDYSATAPVARRIKEYMATMTDQLRWVHATNDEYIPGVSLDIDEQECARLGVNRAALSLNLSAMLGGTTIASLWEDGTNVPIRLYWDNIDGAESLENQLIPTAMPNSWVPLRQVAKVKPDWTRAVIDRRFNQECITIAADMIFWKPQTVAMSQIDKFIKEEINPTLPEGVEIKYGGLSSINSDVIPEIFISFVVAVLVLFAFLLAYFRKASISLLTLGVSTLCLFGAFFGEWIFGLDFGMTSVLGIVSLIGIIVRNGIVMYEYAEELRFKEGYSVFDAAKAAGSRRMRPIFLTSATTALGVLPMIISHNPLWMPMGVVICFGVVLSMIIILAVMPVAYYRIFKSADKHE